MVVLVYWCCVESRDVDVRYSVLPRACFGLALPGLESKPEPARASFELQHDAFDGILPRQWVHRANLANLTVIGVGWIDITNAV